MMRTPRRIRARRMLTMFPAPTMAPVSTPAGLKFFWHVILVLEQVAFLKVEHSWRCSWLQDTPCVLAPGTWTLKESFPHCSSWHTCSSLDFFHELESHRTSHFPLWNTFMTPSQGLWLSPSPRTTLGWKPEQMTMAGELS